MAIPELYRYGREGAWFGTWPFLIYMLEGAYQVRNQRLNLYADTDIVSL